MSIARSLKASAPIIVLFFLAGCTHMQCPTVEANLPTAGRIDAFVYRGMESLPKLWDFSMDEIYAALGRPVRSTSHQVQNIHEEGIMDTVHDLVFRGLEIVIYEAKINDRKFVTRIRLTGRQYPTLWDLGVGTARNCLMSSFGPPYSISGNSWWYRPREEGSGSDVVIFEFSGERVKAMEWRYFLD